MCPSEWGVRPSAAVIHGCSVKGSKSGGVRKVIRVVDGRF